MEPFSFYDNYGFEYKWTVPICEKFDDYYTMFEEKRTKAWDLYLSKKGGVDQIDVESKEFKEMMHGGLPMCYRPAIWMKYLNTNERMKKSQDIYKETLSCTEVVKSKYMDTIKKDVPRTFTFHKTLQRDQLENVLAAFTAIHPDLGYCQSINFIAAILIVILGEEPAFFVLSTIIEDYLPDDYYADGMHGFRIDLKLFNYLLKEYVPDVYEHSMKLNHEWMMSASNWLLALFSNTFPIPTVLRIWDTFLVDGEEAIFRVSLGFIRMHAQELLKENKISTFTRLIEQLENEMIDHDALMAVSFSIPSFSRNRLVELRSYAVKFVDTGVDEEPKKKGFFSMFRK